MNSRSPFLVVGILVAAIATAVIMVVSRPEPPRAAPPSQIPVVLTELVDAVDGPLVVRGSGSVRPKSQVALAPQIGGRISGQASSLVTGGRFSRGDVLLEIEQADFQNAVRTAEAQVAEAQVGLLQADEEARIAREEYEQFARRAGGSIADASPLTLREPQLRSAQAGLARAEAQLADATLALQRTRLRAPFDGVVISESAEVGNFAAPGQVLAQIYALDPLEAVIPLTDASAGLLPGLWNLRAGSRDRSLPATISTSYGGARFAWTGFVDRAEATLDEQTRTVDVIIRIPAPFTSGRRMDEPVAGDRVRDVPPLLVGQFVDVEIEGQIGEWTVVPRRALRAGNEVWVVRDSRVVIVPVDVLQRVEERLFVTGALTAGDEAIVSGIDFATTGQEVTVQAREGAR